MEDEINLLDYWRVLMRRKRLITMIVGCVTVLSIIYALLAPKFYRAEASLLPIGGQQGSGTAALIAQSSLGGLLGGIGGGTSTSSLMVVLKSRTLTERVIQKLDLTKILFKEIWDHEKGDWKVSEDEIPNLETVVRTLRGMVTLTEDKKMTLINIASESKDPKLSAHLVNGYIEALANYLVENELTSTKRNRIFIEAQLEKNKVLLLETGKELSQFYGNHRISNRDPRIDVNVGIGARGERIGKSGKRKADSGKGSGGKRTSLAEESERLQNEVTVVEQKIVQGRLVKDVPQQIYLEYLTSYYQLLGQMSALLTQQYEMAKINEAKEDISFQVIDWARVPHKRFKPKRRQIVMISFIMSFFMAIFVALFLEYLEKMREAGK